MKSLNLYIELFGKASAIALCLGMLFLNSNFALASCPDGGSVCGGTDEVDGKMVDFMHLGDFQKVDPKESEIYRRAKPKLDYLTYLYPDMRGAVDSTFERVWILTDKEFPARREGETRTILQTPSFVMINRAEAAKWDDEEWEMRLNHEAVRATVTELARKYFRAIIGIEKNAEGERSRGLYLSEPELNRLLSHPSMRERIDQAVNRITPLVHLSSGAGPMVSTVEQALGAFHWKDAIALFDELGLKGNMSIPEGSEFLGDPSQASLSINVLDRNYYYWMIREMGFDRITTELCYLLRGVANRENSVSESSSIIKNFGSVTNKRFNDVAYSVTNNQVGLHYGPLFHRFKEFVVKLVELDKAVFEENTDIDASLVRQYVENCDGLFAGDYSIADMVVEFRNDEGVISKTNPNSGVVVGLGDAIKQLRETNGPAASALGRAEEAVGGGEIAAEAKAQRRGGAPAETPEAVVDKTGNAG